MRKVVNITGNCIDTPAEVNTFTDLLDTGETVSIIGRVTILRSGHHRFGSRLLFSGMAIWTLAYLLFFPRTFAIVDEDAYLTQAYLFRTGHITYEQSPIPAPHMTVEHDGRIASKYPPGTALLLLPFTLLGWRAPFVVGLLLALLGTWLFRRVLHEIEPGADPAWALLWLAYPVVTLFARTLMSDLPAATLVLAAFLLLVRKRTLAAGVLLGVACLVRFSVAALVPVFALLVLLEGKSRLRRVILLLLGLLPFGLAALGYNWYCYGGPLQFPMYLTGQFAPGFFPRNAWFYARNLVLFYPLMLFLPLFVRRGWRWRISLPAYTILLVYCFFSYVHDVPDLAERLTVGMRYLLPGMAFFILGTAVALHRLDMRIRGFRFAKYGLLLLLLGASVAIQYRHDRYLAVQDRYRKLLYATVPEDGLVVCNKDVSELVSFAWGPRRYRRFVEFNVPIPVMDDIAAADSAWMVLLQKPGKTNLVETVLFYSLLARFDRRRKVVEVESPYRFQAWLVTPAASSPPR